MNAPAVLPYDLRIGVTGHRELPDPAGVARAVAELLNHIQTTLESAAEFPHGPSGAPQTVAERMIALLGFDQHTPVEQRTPIEWTAFSPLAHGADRIVARAVLQRPNSRLQVVMPFNVDDYRQDFIDPADRAEFEELLKRDATPVELQDQSGRPGAGNSPEQRDNKQARRSIEYLKVGQSVVDACEILVAVWDGEPSAGRGGTADVVKYALDEGRVVLWINSAQPANPVRMLVTGQAQTNLPAAALGIAYGPLPHRAKELSANFCELAAYNRDRAFDAVKFERIADQGRKRLEEAAKEANIPNDIIAAWVEQYLPHYARADQLAIHYQWLYVQGAIWLYVLSAFSVTLSVAQVLFLQCYNWLTLPGIGIIVLVLLLWRRSKSEAWHEKWLHDRHLAERIRIAMFTSVFGMAPEAAQPHKELPFYPGPDGWMIDTVKRIVQSGRSMCADRLPLESLKRFVVQAWIADQASFHQSNAHRKHQWVRRWHRIGVLLFLTTIGLALLQYFLSADDAGEHAETGTDAHWAGEMSTFLAIVLPAWGSAIHAVSVLLDRERIVARSRRMHALLAAIAVRAQAATSLDELRVEIEHATKVMAAENHEWWVSLSYRGLLLPG